MDVSSKNSKTTVTEPAVNNTCYHCGQKTTALMQCEIWAVGTCHSCLDKFHRQHHINCRKDVSALKKQDERRNVKERFSVLLTRYDGKMFSIICQLGQRLNMSDHWAGTYLLFPSGMILVLETRAEINMEIIRGLRKIQST